jgi:putative phosphoesterase
VAGLIGLIADTHGLVRPDVHTALAGVDLILHAGDVGGADVLAELALIAPVRAVRGNTDPPGDPELVDELVYEVDGIAIHLSHGHEVGSPTPARLAERYAERVIVYGHTHRQLVSTIGEQLVINPGAAGPRRFDLSPSVAVLTVANGRVSVEVRPLRALARRARLKSGGSGRPGTGSRHSNRR